MVGYDGAIQAWMANLISRRVAPYFTIRGENIHIGSTKYNTPLMSFLQQVDKNFSLLLRSCLRRRKQVGNTLIVAKTMH